MNSWLLEHMVCPRHRSELLFKVDQLVCRQRCRFPVIQGIPVMLLEEAQQTMDLCGASLDQASKRMNDGNLYVESLGLTGGEKEGILELAKRGSRVDAVVAYLIGATNGIAYKHLIGRLDEYPIPELRLSAASGKVFLDVGCSWGRWTVAAARKGFTVVGIDPSLGAVMAAKRVAQQLGVNADFIVGDARFLPLKSGVIDQAFSYSVLQHFSREDAAQAVEEMGRVLKTGGASFVQMPTKLGLRCLYHQARRAFREGKGFEVRYWSLPALRSLFSASVGETDFSVDCFFGIGLQRADLHLMSPILRTAIFISEGLRSISRTFPPLVWLADSVYVSSIKRSI